MKISLLVVLAVTVLGEKPTFLFLLGDDIGWSDFGYNGGTAATPNIDEWSRRAGTVVFQDGHSGGTVCSPTRATILTGRNHFRDCVSYVYGCSDMTECEPDFPFAQQRTFTIADAARKAGYSSFFGGKWHLGSFFNDSAFPSSPLFHGFSAMNATVEVAPTRTANAQCDVDWNRSVEWGHYKAPIHCRGGVNPGGDTLPAGCCFNYWSGDDSREHGVTNLSQPSDADDSQYVASSFEGFVRARENSEPFLAQLSFHNCHIPYIGQQKARAACAAGDTCAPSNGRGDVSANYSDAQLEFYACLSELDQSLGRVLRALPDYDDTLVWFTTDNGPEGNCARGACDDSHYRDWPGDAGLLRGRKRDVWEGGHRVPTIVSWPKKVRAPARVSWATVVTMDFFSTILETLAVQRPAGQQTWPIDGQSIAPLLAGAEDWLEPREIGWTYFQWPPTALHGYGYRRGRWKLVVGYANCSVNCSQPMLFDLLADLGETTNLAAVEPEILAELEQAFVVWAASVSKSRANESLCDDQRQNPDQLAAVHYGAQLTTAQQVAAGAPGSGPGA